MAGIGILKEFDPKQDIVEDLERFELFCHKSEVSSSGRKRWLLLNVIEP